VILETLDTVGGVRMPLDGTRMVRTQVPTRLFAVTRQPTIKGAPKAPGNRLRLLDGVWIQRWLDT
jgi:hypothetical protein